MTGVQTCALPIFHIDLALKVGKINVDEQMELAMRFQVSSIPMLVVFKDGKAVAKSVGYRPKSEIAAMVEGAR